MKNTMNARILSGRIILKTTLGSMAVPGLAASGFIRDVIFFRH
ncbi:hypothetical protein [Emticicia sp. BO119]|nr:hypothetical protein [Emticicia sp. BO119]